MRSDRQNKVVAAAALLVPMSETLPIGTARPTPFTTTLLAPQTKKIPHGTMTILPSCSLLVDFREGMRRRGEKGNEILVISQDGSKVSMHPLFSDLFKLISGLYCFQIEVYSAPHLSVPSCLIEPMVIYALGDLPSKYWRQYNDAHIYVQGLKRRTPKVRGSPHLQIPRRC
jgi:polo-like kinase 4